MVAKSECLIIFYNICATLCHSNSNLGRPHIKDQIQNRIWKCGKNLRQNSLCTKCIQNEKKNTAATRDRTRDLQIFSLTLSQLSYHGGLQKNRPSSKTNSWSIKSYVTWPKQKSIATGPMDRDKYLMLLYSYIHLLSL